MKKKWLLIFSALLTVTSLVACSNSKEETTSKSSSTEQTSTTKSSTKESTSESSTVTLKESTVTYLADAEIDAIQTIGEYKTSLNLLMDSYVADFDGLIVQLPEEAQTTLKPYREQIVTMLEQQKSALDSQFATLGDDSTVIPEEARATVLDSLKTVRDQLKQTMTVVHEQAQTLLNE
ncbi:hypothetical protein [Streptococcus suis]|uniref:hypothetical protein n=1 Tax=Streptococcus suis TaxID=1307 RepID=UPI000942B601|nr:hypothetical protein [Streptococcus suis]